MLYGSWWTDVSCIQCNISRCYFVPFLAPTLHHSIACGTIRCTNIDLIKRTYTDLISRYEQCHSMCSSCRNRYSNNKLGTGGIYAFLTLGTTSNPPLWREKYIQAWPLRTNFRFFTLCLRMYIQLTAGECRNFEIEFSFY